MCLYTNLDILSLLGPHESAGLSLFTESVTAKGILNELNIIVGIYLMQNVDLNNELYEACPRTFSFCLSFIHRHRPHSLIMHSLVHSLITHSSSSCALPFLLLTHSLAQCIRDWIHGENFVTTGNFRSILYIGIILIAAKNLRKVYNDWLFARQMVMY